MRSPIGRGWFWLACAAGAALAPAATAGPVQNAGFESPALVDGAVQQVTPDGWAWVGPMGFVFNVVGTAQTAAEGSQFVDIGNTSSFSLRQAFTVALAGRYQLSWYDNAAAFFQVAPYQMTLGQGQPEFAFDANEGIDGTWNRRVVEADLLPGTAYTLAFSPRDIPGPLPAQDRFIDGFSITAVSPAVPEPSVAWLVVAGMAGIVSARRRLRTSA